MSVKKDFDCEYFDDEGLSPDIPKTNQVFVSASRQIREMLVNGDLYAKKMQGLLGEDDEDLEALEESDNQEASPFSYNRNRCDDTVLEDTEKLTKVVRKINSKRAKKVVEPAPAAPQQTEAVKAEEVNETK